MIKWLKALFVCEHDWSISHSVYTEEKRKCRGGTLHLSKVKVIKECSKCGKKKHWRDL